MLIANSLAVVVAEDRPLLMLQLDWTHIMQGQRLFRMAKSHGILYRVQRVIRSIEAPLRAAAIHKSVRRHPGTIFMTQIQEMVTIIIRLKLLIVQEVAPIVIMCCSILMLMDMNRVRRIRLREVQRLQGLHQQE